MSVENAERKFWIIIKMGLKKYIGTGKAKCRKCCNIIEKGDIGLEVSGWRMSEKYCDYCVKEILELKI